MTQLVHYILIRRDLPTGAACAQIVHAAGESASQRMWPLPDRTIAVVLGVRDEKQLKYYHGRLVRADIESVIIYEHEGPFGGQYTAIGVLPTADREKVRAVVKKLMPVKEFNDASD